MTAPSQLFAEIKQLGNLGLLPALQLTADEVAAIQASGLPVTFDAAATTLVANLLPGEHKSITLPSAGTYRVDADMDVLVKNSVSSAIYGSYHPSSVGTSGAYSTTPGSLAAQTGLSFGVASFTVDAWVEVDGPITSSNRVFDFGVTSGGPRFSLYVSNAASSYFRVASTLVGSAGVSIIDDSSAGALTDPWVLGSSLVHVALVVTRAAASGTGTLTYFLNGVQVRTATWTEAAGTPTTFDLTTATGGTSRLCIGGTSAGSALFYGRIEGISFYNVALTVSQIQARVAAGPLRPLGIDVGDASLKWKVDFQQSGSWSNPLHPECVSGYGNAVFNTLIGSPSITQRTGGAAASSQDSARVYAGRPQAVACSLGGYLNVYGDSASGGTVRVTPI